EARTRESRAATVFLAIGMGASSVRRHFTRYDSAKKGETFKRTPPINYPIFFESFGLFVSKNN
ncbi:hypothetical protein, partial [Gordonibacter massiliensis (ex Traore et al. 2017)]|uniref:hypothetical protein n=1 Tax=Gordonibacter massiliensis (ex Traore et al. 2017) TaxID=1841863 RepID=UPI001C8D8001